MTASLDSFLHQWRYAKSIGFEMNGRLGNLARNFLVAWKLPSWRWALLVAGISDVAGLWLMMFPPAQWVLDIATAVSLLLILGFRWPILSVLAIEVVPFLQMFPAWILVVIALASSNNGRATTVQPD